jgi:hypothetical protein
MRARRQLTPRWMMIEFRYGLIDLKNPTNSVSIGVGVAVDTDSDARAGDSRSADDGDERFPRWTEGRAGDRSFVSSEECRCRTKRTHLWIINETTLNDIILFTHTNFDTYNRVLKTTTQSKLYIHPT